MHLDGDVHRHARGEDVSLTTLRGGVSASHDGEADMPHSCDARRVTRSERVAVPRRKAEGVVPAVTLRGWESVAGHAGGPQPPLRWSWWWLRDGCIQGVIDVNAREGVASPSCTTLPDHPLHPPPSPPHPTPHLPPPTHPDRTPTSFPAGSPTPSPVRGRQGRCVTARTTSYIYPWSWLWPWSPCAGGGTAAPAAAAPCECAFAAAPCE